MFRIIHRVGKNIFRIITTQRDALEADFSFNERKTIFLRMEIIESGKKFCSRNIFSSNDVTNVDVDSALITFYPS